MALLSANLFVCEKVLTEPQTGKLTAINIVDTVSPLARSSTMVRFFAMTMVYGYAGDAEEHVLSVKLSKFNGEIVNQAPDYPFKHAYKIDTDAPGGLHLYTEFVVDIAQLGVLEKAYVLWSFLDGQAVAKTPLYAATELNATSALFPGIVLLSKSELFKALLRCHSIAMEFRGETTILAPLRSMGSAGLAAGGTICSDTTAGGPDSTTKGRTAFTNSSRRSTSLIP